MLHLIFLICSISNRERELRSTIFTDYNKEIRPVINYSDPIIINIGIDIKGLE